MYWQSKMSVGTQSVLVWQALVWQIWIALRYSQREGIEWEEEWKSWVNEIAKENCPQVLPGCKNVGELLSAERVCKLVNNNDKNKQYKLCFPKNIIKWTTQEIFWCVN